MAAGSIYLVGQAMAALAGTFTATGQSGAIATGVAIAHWKPPSGKPIKKAEIRIFNKGQTGSIALPYERLALSIDFGQTKIGYFVGTGKGGASYDFVTRKITVSGGLNAGVLIEQCGLEIAKAELAVRVGKKEVVGKASQSFLYGAVGVDVTALYVVKGNVTIFSVDPKNGFQWFKGGSET
jgi:hypothetical protein